MSTKNFVVKNGLTVGNVSIDAASGNLITLNAALGNLASANFFSGDGSLLTNVNVANISGNVAYANTAGYVVESAQANITSVGTLISLAVTGNVSAGNVLTDHLLYANGSAWDLQEAAGANTQIQFNDGSNNFGASANFTFNNVTQVLTVTGNISVGNVGGANLVSANYVTGTLTTAAQPNITSTGTLISLDVTGNVAAGNVTGANVVSANFVTGTLTTAAQPNITSTGTLTSLAVTGTTTSGNIYANSGTVGASLLTGTLTTAAQPNITSTGTLTSLDVTGNISAGNVGGANSVSANFVTGTLTTAAQPNITSTGTLTSLAVSGNITAANVAGGNVVSANFVTGTLTTAAQPNITSTGTLSSLEVTGNISTDANLVTDIIVGKTSGVSITAVGTNQNITLTPTGTGAVSVASYKIINLATPVASTDAATKQYVDEVAQGLDPKASVAYATTTSLPAYTYNNGTSGVGATITANANGALSLDGAAPSANDRVLIKNETSTNTPYNGIYVVTTAGSGGTAFVLTRTTDFDSSSPSGEIPGAFVFVESGSVNADTSWVCTTDSPVTVGTTNIVFVQFSGAGTYTAGAGLTLTGTVFSVNVDDITTEISAGNVIVKANAAFTTPNIGAATGTSLNLTGNLLAGNVNSNTKITTVDFDASGNIIAANISANANLIVNNATVNLALSGNTANFSGNVVVSNLGVNLELSGNTANFSGNIVTLNANLGNLATANYVNVAQQVNGNIANFSGNLTAANANLGNLATANFFTGVLINGTSNAQIDGVNGNFNISVAGNANVVQVTASSANITGTANITGSANISEKINLGNAAVNTTITWGSVTTTAITANQTIATFSKTGVTGVEFLVKGIDSTGSKYSVATVQAVTDGTNVDFSTFAGVNLGSTTGSLVVNIVGSNIALQVTPTSSNSTVWTTQFRLI